jgi:hypothetical protein
VSVLDGKSGPYKKMSFICEYNSFGKDNNSISDIGYKPVSPSHGSNGLVFIGISFTAKTPMPWILLGFNFVYTLLEIYSNGVIINVYS